MKKSPLLTKDRGDIQNQKNNKIIATFNKERHTKLRCCNYLYSTDYDPITNKFDTSSIIK